MMRKKRPEGILNQDEKNAEKSIASGAGGNEKVDFRFKGLTLAMDGNKPSYF